MVALSPVAQVVVAQPDGPEGWTQARPAVGVVTARAEQPIISIIVKATFSYKGAGGDGPATLRWSARQLPLSLDEPSLLPNAQPRELYYPSDFAPRKKAVDVMLTGHGYAAEPSRRIECALEVSDLRRSFTLRHATPVAAIALCGAQLVGEDAPSNTTAVGADTPSNAAAAAETEAEAVMLRVAPGPLRCTGHDDLYYGEGFDYSVYQNAAASQQLDALAPGSSMTLKGLTRGRPTLELVLPTLSPVVRVAALWWGERTVDMCCDTLWLDTDREQLVMVWRGDVEVVDDGGEIKRIVVSLENPQAPRDSAFIDSALQRGHFSYAVRQLDLLPGAAAIPKDDEGLRAAHRATFAAAAPAPTLSLERYATIAAMLAENPSVEHRDAVLKRNGFSELSWTSEERGWMEQIANQALDGDARLAEQYSKSFTEAQDGLAAEAEQQVTFDQFVDMFATIAATADPTGVLRDNKLTMAQWMRINRRMMADMQRDKVLTNKFRDRLSQLTPSQPDAPNNALFDGSE